VAKIGLSVLKRIPYRGSTQHFSNVYFYARGLGGASDAELTAILDEVVAQEKLMHTSAVTFVRGRVWTADGTPQQNEMRVIKELTGVGSLASVTGMDPENAILLRVRAGKSSTGKPVYLRKFYRPQGPMLVGNWSGNVIQRSSQLPAAEMTAWKNAADTLLAVGAGPDIWGLVAESGREVTQPAAFECHPWLEHRELGDEWRP
jgi:hypothetical protein